MRGVGFVGLTDSDKLLARRPPFPGLRGRGSYLHQNGDKVLWGGVGKATYQYLEAPFYKGPTDPSPLPYLNEYEAHCTPSTHSPKKC